MVASVNDSQIPPIRYSIKRWAKKLMRLISSFMIPHKTSILKHPDAVSAGRLESQTRTRRSLIRRLRRHNSRTFISILCRTIFRIKWAIKRNIKRNNNQSPRQNEILFPKKRRIRRRLVRVNCDVGFPVRSQLKIVAAKASLAAYATRPSAHIRQFCLRINIFEFMQKELS